MITPSDVRDKADYVRRLATDLRALELFADLTPEDVNGLHDTVDPGFYDSMNVAHDRLDFVREQGVDLGNEFDYLTEMFNGLTDYHSGPYETVVAELEAAAACLNASTGLSTAFSAVEAGAPDSVDVTIPDEWAGDFVTTLRDHVVNLLPYHRLYHLALISQLVDITNAHMVLHQMVIDGLYDILETTRQKLQATIDAATGAELSVLHYSQIAVALLQVGAALTGVGVAATVGLAVLNAGVVAASAGASVATLTDEAKSQASSSKVEITGDTSFDIIDSMHEAVNTLTSNIPDEEFELADSISDATLSLTRVLTAGDTVNATEASKFAWRIVPIRPAIADDPPRSDTDFRYAG